MNDHPATPVDRARLPAILWPEDVAAVLGLAGARAAREFLVRHGVPHARVGGRVYVLSETLVAFLREREERRPSREELRERADEVVTRVAPARRGPRRRGVRKGPAEGGELT